MSFPLEICLSCCLRSVFPPLFMSFPLEICLSCCLRGVFPPFFYVFSSLFRLCSLVGYPSVSSAGVRNVSCIHTCIHKYIRTYTHAYIHAYVHTCMHTYIHAYIHACMHTYVHAYVHTYIYTYIHTYIHTRLTIIDLPCCTEVSCSLWSYFPYLSFFVTILLFSKGPSFCLSLSLTLLVL
jgi:hypothetical protein